MRPAATIAVVVATLAATGFFVATAVYALLVYLPFTYQQFILSKVIPGLAAFADWHHVLFWGALAATAAASLADLRTAAARRQTRLLLFGGLLMAVYLTAWPLLPRLRSDRSSLVVCLVSLVPVLWIACLGVLSGRGRFNWSADDGREDRRLFTTAVCAAIFVSLTYLAIAAARAGMPVAALHPVRMLAIALTWSLALHLVLFGAFFLAILAFKGAVRAAGGSTLHEAMLLFVAATALTALMIKQLVFAAVSFTGPTASLVAAALALSVTAIPAGLAIWLHRLSDQPIRGGLEVFTAPLASLGAPTAAAWRRGVAVILLAAMAAVLAVQTAMNDWNYLLQKLSAIFIWVVAFAAFHAMNRGGRGAVPALATVWLLAGAVVPALAYRALSTSQDRVSAWLDEPGASVRSVLDGHAGFNPSFKVLHDAVVAVSGREEQGFFRLLQRNTNIPREVRIEPVAVDLVRGLAPRTGPAPHIFVIVIDSLRQDYLSAYNPQVAFTPAIDALARESVVFKRAFTQYGATGLSEPSIWVGGLLLHKQYVLPFAPMNALDKLLTVDGYQRYISRDTILRTIMPAGETDIELDAGVANMDYDLCRSLTDLRMRVASRSATAPPIFAYTQPQNIHVSVINRAGTRVAGGGTFAGFHPPYAARVQQMDRCIGEFVQFLRDQGLYDDSVIVLTSDHGDSLGEGGRWGHAYTIFPEIVRIPLVVHLPRAMQGAVTCDTDAVASLVDITPTLYYLLGHRPLLAGSILGRPLCTATPQERIASRRDSYSIVSSYGPVYGVLRGNGRWLYIADGVNYADYYYDLEGDPASGRNLVTPAVRIEHQPLIRRHLDELNRFYGRGAPPP